MTYQIKGFGWLINIMKQKKKVLGPRSTSGPKRGFRGPIGGSIIQSHEKYLMWHIKLKYLAYSLILWSKKLSFWAPGQPQGPKEVFRAPFRGWGLNSTKSWKIPSVTYQIKEFCSLINILKLKMSFGALGPLQGPKCIFKGPFILICHMMYVCDFE